MANKISLTNLVNLTNQTTAVSAINANNTALTTAINNTLSRDGTPPNQMGSAMDMNSNRILNLPTAISTSEPVNLAQMTAALVANGNINTGITGVPVSAAMQPVVNAITIASAQTQLKIPTPYVDATLYGVTADGVTDDTVALQAAITAAAGREVRLPPGTIVVTSQVHYITNTNFVSGLRLRGSGSGVTSIDNRVANNSCIYSAGSSNAFQLGGYVKDLSIKTTTNPPNSHGIEHYAAYQYDVEDLFITGLSGDACRVTANIGDADASNEMHYTNLLINTCNIGINCNFAAGVVQPSFMRVTDCDIQNCTIGWRWIGLSGMSINSGFAICGTGLNIVNNGSSNAQFTSFMTSFENNAVAMNLNLLAGGEFIQTELACSSAVTTSTQTAILNSVSGVKFSGTRVRISNSPNTLWTLGTGTTGNQICNSFYQNYDNSGQTRYSITSGLFGNRIDDSFDSVQIGSQSGNQNISFTTGSNENVVIPLDGAVYFTSGPTNNFSVGGLTNGFDGRRLTIVNNSGFVMTLNAEDTSSTAANRIRTATLGNVIIGVQGTCTLIYTSNLSRWFLVGQG